MKFVEKVNEKNEVKQNNPHEYFSHNFLTQVLSPQHQIFRSVTELM